MRKRNMVRNEGGVQWWGQSRGRPDGRKSKKNVMNMAKATYIGGKVDELIQ
jgi:hypothetical protein